MFRIRHSGDSEIHSVIPPSPERRTPKSKKTEQLYSGVRSRLKAPSPDGGEVSTSNNATMTTKSTEMDETPPRRNTKPAPTTATAKATAKLAAQRNSRRALSPTESPKLSSTVPKVTAAAGARSLSPTSSPTISKVVSTPKNNSMDDSLYNPTLSSSGRSATRRMLAQSKELLHDRNSIQEGEEFTSPMDNPGKSRRLKAEDLGDDSVDSIHISSTAGRNQDDEDDELFGDFSEFNKTQRRKQRQPSPRTPVTTSSKATRTTKKAETLSMSTNSASKNNFHGDDDDYSFRRTPGRQQRSRNNRSTNKEKESSRNPTTTTAAIADVDWNKITGDDVSPTTSESKNNKYADDYEDEFMTLQSRGSSVSSLSRGSYSRGGTPRSSPTASGSGRKMSGGRKKAEDLDNTTSIHGGDDEDDDFMSPRKSRLSGVSNGRKKKAEDLGAVSSIHGGDDEDDYDDEFMLPRKPASSKSSRASSGRKKRAEDLGSVTSIHGGDDDDDDDEDNFDGTSPLSESSGRKTKAKFSNGNSGRKKKAEDLGSVTSIHGGDEDEEDDFTYRTPRAGGGSRFAGSNSGRRPTGGGSGRKRAEDLGNVSSIHGGDDDEDEEEFEDFSVLSRRKHSPISSSSRRKKAEDLGNVTSIHGDDEEDEKKEKDVDEYYSADYGTPRRSTAARSTGRKKAESLSAVTSIHGGDDEIELSYGAKSSYESSPVNRSRAVAAERIATNSSTTPSQQDNSNTAAIFQIRQKLVDVLNDIDTLSLEGNTKFNAKDLRAMNGIRTKVVDAIDDVGSSGSGSREQHVQQIRQKLSKALMELDSMP